MSAKLSEIKLIKVTEFWNKNVPLPWLIQNYILLLLSMITTSAWQSPVKSKKLFECGLANGVDV